MLAGTNPGRRAEPAPASRRSSVTIADIAQAAGVSVGTVSHYLNKTANVSPATAEAVRAAIARLNYQPNLNARSLRVQATQSLGLVLPNLINPFWAELAALVGKRAWEVGYQLIVCSADDSEASEERHLESLHQRRVDGALVVVTGNSLLKGAAQRLPFPTLFIDRRVEGQPSVTTDNLLGGRLAMEHLVGLGHRRIGLIVGEEHVENIQERLAGARQVLEENGLGTRSEYLIRGSQSIETGRLAERWWELDRPPTGVFTTNDVIALGVWQSCLRAGVRIPEDVSLIGYDDIHWSQLTVPPLTTIAQDMSAVVGRGLERLLAATAEEPLSDDSELIPPSLVVRESTRKVGA